MTQTAVEWLINRYADYGTLYYEDMTKAKEMEKEQTLKFARNSVRKVLDEDEQNPFNLEEYYNETFNKIEPTESKEPTPEVFYAGWVGLFQDREDLKK